MMVNLHVHAHCQSTVSSLISHFFLQMEQSGLLTNVSSCKCRPNHGLARYPVVISVHVGSPGVNLQEKSTE